MAQILLVKLVLVFGCFAAAFGEFCRGSLVSYGCPRYYNNYDDYKCCAEGKEYNYCCTEEEYRVQISVGGFIGIGVGVSFAAFIFVVLCVIVPCVLIFRRCQGPQGGSVPAEYVEYVSTPDEPTTTTGHHHVNPQPVDTTVAINPKMEFAEGDPFQTKPPSLPLDSPPPYSAGPSPYQGSKDEHRAHAGGPNVP